MTKMSTAKKTARTARVATMKGIGVSVIMTESSGQRRQETRSPDRDPHTRLQPLPELSREDYLLASVI